MTISWLSPSKPASRRRTAVVGAAVAWLVVVLTLVLAIAGRPAAAGPEGIKVLAVHTAAAPQVAVVVTMPADQQGPSPAPERVAVSVDGTPVDARVTPMVSPNLAVALVLDTTESEEELRSVQTGATEFLLRLPVGVRTTVVATGAEPRLVTPLTTELTEALSGVSALRLGSPGPAGAAAILAADELAAAPPGPRALVLVNNGSPDGGPSVEEVAQALLRAQVVPTVIATGGGDFWSQVVERTGGTVHETQPGSVVPSFGSAATELADHYLVSFDTPGPLPAQAELTLQTGGGSATTTVALPVAEVSAAGDTASGGGGLGPLWIAVAAVLLLLALLAFALLRRRQRRGATARTSSPALDEPPTPETVQIATRLSPPVPPVASTEPTTATSDHAEQLVAPVSTAVSAATPVRQETVVTRADWPAGIGNWLEAARNGNVQPLHEGLLAAAAQWPRTNGTKTDPAGDLRRQLAEIESDWRGRTAHDVAARLTAAVDAADTSWRERTRFPPAAGRSIQRLALDAVGAPESPKPPDEAVRGAVELVAAVESYRAEHQPSEEQEKQRADLLRRIVAWERPDSSGASKGDRKSRVDTYVILGDGLRNADELHRLVIDIDRIFQARCEEAASGAKELTQALAPLLARQADQSATTQQTVLAGEGNATVDLSADVPRPAIVHITGNASSNFFGIRALGTDVALVNTTSPYDGTRFLDWNGERTTGFEVQANGPWQIEVLPPMSAAPFASSHVGSGDSVLHFTGAGSVLEISGNGVGLYFGVRVGSAAGNAAEIVSTTDPYAESIAIDPDIEFFEIQAVGPWTITVS